MQYKTYLQCLMVGVSAIVAVSAYANTGNYYSFDAGKFVDLSSVPNGVLQVRQNAQHQLYLVNNRDKTALQLGPLAGLRNHIKPKLTWVDAGPIMSNSGSYKSAKIICPGVCNKIGNWNGQWRTIRTKQHAVTSVCQCFPSLHHVYFEQSPPRPQPVVAPNNPFEINGSI